MAILSQSLASPSFLPINAQHKKEMHTTSAAVRDRSPSDTALIRARRLRARSGSVSKQIATQGQVPAQTAKAQAQMSPNAPRGGLSQAMLDMLIVPDQSLKSEWDEDVLRRVRNLRAFGHSQVFSV